MTTARVLGRSEIADFLEVDPRTPYAWYSRHLLPTPDHESVNGGPAWERDSVLLWAVNTGRLPDSLRDEAAIKGLGAPHHRRGGREAKRAFGDAS